MIFILGKGLVSLSVVSQKRFMPSLLLWCPGERLAWGPGLTCFAWMWILMGFLVTAGLSCSVIFKLLSAEELILGAKKGGQNGDGAPESQLCFLLRGNLFMPFAYWISINFYQNNISKVKITWKITHLAQPFYLRDKKIEPQRKELICPRTPM